MTRNKIGIKASVTLAYALSLILSATCAGCGGSVTEAGGTEVTAAGEERRASQEPVKFKVILGYQTEVPPEDNPVVRELNSLANADIQIEWTPAVFYNDRFNLLMASNQLPDVLLVPDPKLTAVLNAARAGLFWELGPMLAEYPNLQTYSPLYLANMSIDGRVYMLPRERDVKRKMVLYRKDWAQKAGVGAPDTLDNIYAMARAFAEGDYDGNNKRDTIGLALGTVVSNGVEIDTFHQLVVANGGFNGWGAKDGRVIPSFMTPEYLDTLKWLKKMYDEKLISPDFAITKTTQLVTDFVEEEKTGLWLGWSLIGLSSPLLKAKRQADPEITRGDLIDFTFLKGPDGRDRIAAESGVAGGFAFPKSTVRDEARLRELMGVFDKFRSREGQILINNGIEGVHFSLVQVGNDTGTRAISASLAEKEVSPMGQLGIGGALSYTAADDEINIRLIKARRTYAPEGMIADVTAPLISDTYAANKTNLDDLISNAFFSFILGQISEEQWNRTLDKWLASGGERVIEEYTAAYNGTRR